MRLNHRLKRLEASAPPPRCRCPHCGIADLKDGTGVVSPGWIVPETISDPSAAMMIGCKSCFAWVKVKNLPEPSEDGTFHLIGATRCECPEYV
jgi:hypothetical protein